MACGCPVVATRNTGAEDLFDDGVEGLIVSARDSDALCAAIQRIADDPKLRSRFSRAAIQRVRLLGGWSHYGSTVYSVMKNILAAKSQAPHRREDPIRTTAANSQTQQIAQQ